jgi:amino acid adenylation domain-containing protein
VQAWLNAAVIVWLASELELDQYTLGVPITGRFGSAAAGLPCMAMNILPLSVAWSREATFEELARAVMAEQRAARPHQRYRYEDLRRELAATTQGRPFGVVVNWMPFDAAQLAGLRCSKRPFSAGPVEDLAVAFGPEPSGLRVDLEANPDTYDAACLARCHTALLETIGLLAGARLLRLGDLPRRRSVTDCLALLDGGPLSTPVVPVLEAVVATARAFPGRVALEQHGRSSVTYAELVRAAAALAAQLRHAGVTAGDRVALLLPRSQEAVVAQVAVLWLGASYVPLDPLGPVERVRGVLDDCGPSLVVTGRQHTGLAADRRYFVLDGLSSDVELGGDAPNRTVTTESLAYVIYTSGSTGKPNGVMISRAALDHFIAAARERYRVAAQDRVLQFAPLAFDASVEEIWMTLTSGATLVLRSEAMLESPQLLLRACEEHALSVLDLPTAYFHELVQSLNEGTTLPACVRLVIIGGEAVLPDRVARFRCHAPSSTVLLNTYGPTETTVVCTTAQLSGPDALTLDGARAPIGRPLAGVTVAVVDAELALVGLETEGQLCVLGPTLGNGYLHRPELGARRFVRLRRVPGEPTAYLTGDRVRLERDRQLVYLGRLDDELKISGYRVSPAEVEAALVDLEEVEEAAVIASDAGGHEQLVAFVVTSSPAATSVALRERLGPKLAPPAIPARIHLMLRLPRDANGKIARAELRAQDKSDAQPAAPATSPLEDVVLRVWREVLGAEVSDLDASFFSLGGHSLLALSVAGRLGRALNRNVPLSALFRFPSVRGLAQSLREASSGEYLGQSPLAPLIGLQAGRGSALFCLPPADGLAWCYLGLTRYLPEVPLIGLQAPGLSGATPSTFDALVDHYLELVLSTQQHGPYRLLGWSSGGGLAHAVACRLQALGHHVALVAMLDSYPAEMWHGKPEPTEADALVAMLDEADATALQGRDQPLERAELLERIRRPGSSLAEFDEATLLRMAAVALDSMRSYRTAQHQRLRGDVLYFRAAQRAPGAPDPALWQRYVDGSLHLVDVGASHLQMCQPHSLQAVAAALSNELSQGP